MRATATFALLLSIPELTAAQDWEKRQPAGRLQHQFSGPATVSPRRRGNHS